MFNRSASFNQQYTSYYLAMSYSSQSNCCNGYTGVAPSCQGIDYTNYFMHIHT